MKILEKYVVDKQKLKLNCNAKILACLVEINASEGITSIIQEINDTFWLSKLDIINQKCYEARMKKTVEKIMNNCLRFNNGASENTYDYSIVGEYLISKAGRQALADGFNHTALPLAELWKEKMSNNPGFDFHTETLDSIIIFGEAKYNASENPYNCAICQIEEFIDLEKDVKELADLRNLAKQDSISNFLKNNKGFAISFSTKAKNPSRILTNAILSEHICKCALYNEFYLVGVVINDK